MAGTHYVKVSRPDRNNWFEVSAKPAHPLSRVPVLGPFITYNLGRNPRFVVSAKYLGFATSGEEDRPDPKILPDPRDQELWEFDIYLHIDDSYIEGGDNLPVDLNLTTMEGQARQYLTRRWPLTKPGRAELQIGVPNPYTETLYYFEVKDTSLTLATAIFTTIGGIIGGLLVWVLTAILTST